MSRVVIAAALLAAACGGAKELEPVLETGRFTSKADVEKLFEEKAKMSNSNYKEIVGKKSGFKVLPFEYEGSLTCETIPMTGTLRFKGASAGLWVKGTMFGVVDAAEQEGEMRFTGAVAGTVTIGNGVVWFEKVPVSPKFLLNVRKEGTIVVVSSATKQELKTMKTKFPGKSVEMVVFECDHEPGRYKGSEAEWGVLREDGSGQGIHTVTIFAKKGTAQ